MTSALAVARERLESWLQEKLEARQWPEEASADLMRVRRLLDDMVQAVRQEAARGEQPF